MVVALLLVNLVPPTQKCLGEIGIGSFLFFSFSLPPRHTEQTVFLVANEIAA